MKPKTWKMPAAVHGILAGRAEADYPEETCGLVFGEDGALEVVPMRNIQNELHGADPRRHPRDARTAYYFDPTDLQRVLAARGNQRSPFRAIYHSHPDHDAYFSEEDSAAAAPFGEPSYPGVVYLVYSVRSGRVAAVKAFDWSDDEERYVEVPVVIEE